MSFSNEVETITMHNDLGTCMWDNLNDNDTGAWSDGLELSMASECELCEEMPDISQIFIALKRLTMCCFLVATITSKDKRKDADCMIFWDPELKWLHTLTAAPNCTYSLTGLFHAKKDSINQIKQCLEQHVLLFKNLHFIKAVLDQNASGKDWHDSISINSPEVGIIWEDLVLCRAPPKPAIEPYLSDDPALNATTFLYPDYPQSVN